MTAEQLTRLMAALPKEQRYTAGRLIEQAEARRWTNIRFFDRLPIEDPRVEDLIGTDKHGDTEFLCDFQLE